MKSLCTKCGRKLESKPNLICPCGNSVVDLGTAWEAVEDLHRNNGTHIPTLREAIKLLLPYRHIVQGRMEPCPEREKIQADLDAAQKALGNEP